MPIQELHKTAQERPAVRQRADRVIENRRNAGMNPEAVHDDSLGIRERPQTFRTTESSVTAALEPAEWQVLIDLHRNSRQRPCAFEEG